MLLPKRHHIPLTPDEHDYIRANLSLAADGSIVWSVTRGKATKGSRADHLNTNGTIQVKTGRGYRSAKVVRHFLETGSDLYAAWEPTTSEATRSKRAAYVAENYAQVLTEQRAARARTRAVVAPILAQARAQAAAALEAARQERREVLEDLRSLRRILAQDAKDGRRLARRAQRKAELERLRAEKLADPVYQAERERRRREVQQLANERQKVRRHALRPPRVPMTPEEARRKRLAQITEWTRTATAVFRASFVGPPTRQSAMRTWRLEHPGERYPVGWLSERRKVRVSRASPSPAKAPRIAEGTSRTPGIPKSPEARLEAAKGRREARELAAAGRAWDKAAAALVASIRKAWRKAATPAQRTAAQLAADARKREERERQLDAARQRDAELRASLEATRAAQAARRQAEGLAPITYQRDRRPEGRSFLVKADAEQARLTAMPSQTASADAAADRASLIAKAQADISTLIVPRRRPV